MELQTVIKEHCITNPGYKFQHKGYHCNGIMINLTFC